MKNSFKKWLVSIVLVAIVFNLYGSYIPYSKANETSANIVESKTIETEISESQTEETKVDDEVESTNNIESLPKEELSETDSFENIESKNSTNDIEQNKGFVEVYYYIGNNYYDSAVLEGEIGTNFKVDIIDIPGYRYDGKAIEEGVFKEEPSYIIVRYVKEEVPIIIDLTMNDEKNVNKTRPEKVTLTLLKNNIEVAKKVINTGNTTDYQMKVKFDENFEIVDENGKENKYDIKVDGFAKEYKLSSVSRIYPNEIYFFIDSTLMGDKLDILVYKIFGPVQPVRTINNTKNQEEPKEITMHLYRNGVEVQGSPFVLSEDTEWEKTFFDMDRFDENGEEYHYEVIEEPIDGYFPEISISYGLSYDKKGQMYFRILNLPAIDFTMTKIWNGGTKVKPDIILQLYQDKHNGEKPKPFGEPIVLKNGQESYTWKNLPEKYYSQDKYTYFVKEIEIPKDYEVEYSEDGQTIINNYIGPKIEYIDIEGIKIWEDNDDKAGKRPESITVNLMADEKIIETKVITAKDNWKYSFTELEKFKDNKEIIYTISETPVLNYEVSFDGANIINTYTEETKPEKEIETGVVTKETKPNSQNKDKKVLPKTGTVALGGITIAGVALITFGAYSIFKKNK